jgi:hypothetical protein
MPDKRAKRRDARRLPPTSAAMIIHYRTGSGKIGNLPLRVAFALSVRLPGDPFVTVAIVPPAAYGHLKYASCTGYAQILSPGLT